MPSSSKSRFRAFLAHHLYAYLVGVVAVVVTAGIVFAREQLAAAFAAFDPRWILPVLALTVLNYLLRFLKWLLLLGGSGLRVPLGDNALLYFACFTMVVTPARLGELYKLVFLRRLHGVPARRSLPALVMERVTDGLAVLCLAAIQPFAGLGRLAALLGAVAATVAVGAALAHPALRSGWRRWLGRLPLLRRRIAMVDELLAHHAELLSPARLGPSLALSVLAWGSECLGLYLVLRGLGVHLPVGDAAWIYALATLVGNLTFLPGGLGTTEVSLGGLLRAQGVGVEAAVGATVLVRAATLWFAVALGVLVSAAGRGRLQWRAVREEAAREGLEAPAS